MKAGKKFMLPTGTFTNTTDIKAHITSDHTAVAVGIDFFYQAWNRGASPRRCRSTAPRCASDHISARAC